MSETFLKGFDPDAPGGDSLFGLPHRPDQALVHVIPVPWEATASYGRGTRQGPHAVREASVHVDLHDLDFGDFWRAGITLLPLAQRIDRWAAEAEEDALAVIEAGGAVTPALREAAARVDALAERVHDAVYQTARGILEDGRIPAVLGGDHSSPYGLLRAVAEAFPGVGVLHIDAHADLRDAYEGFRWSHASIMHNVLDLPGISRIVGVGYRDIGVREAERIEADSERISAHTDPELARELANGTPWSVLCARIVGDLPDTVYVSFDIDGLDPSLCPNTGTPVPGGLTFRDTQVLLKLLAESRRVVGFDLCEVAPGETEWDANVGARLLYKLAGCAVTSRAREKGNREGRA